MDAPEPPLERTLTLATDALARAEALLIGAGAGMSVDSGIPAFRLNPETGAVAELARTASFRGPASPGLFGTDPEAAWSSFRERLRLFRRVEPHQGYGILRTWAARMPAGAFVLTSNVDGQFAKAGFDEDAILEGHGSVHYLQCSRPCSDKVWSAAGYDPAAPGGGLVGEAAGPPLPRCPDCGAVARPNVFMFGDVRFNTTRTAAQLGRFEAWLAGSDGHRLVAVECGAGTAVPTIRLRCQELCRERGGTLIRINLLEPQVSAVAGNELSLPLGACAALAELDRRLRAGTR